MNKKILLILIAIIAIVIVAVGAIAISLNVFGQTEVDNKFIKATIPGIVTENDVSNSFTGTNIKDWAVEYRDEVNGVLYFFTMLDTLNFTEGMFVNFLNLSKLDTKEYNGNQWDIYYVDTNSFKNTPFNIGISSVDTGAMYLCFASGKNGDYMVIIGGAPEGSNNSLDSDLFKNYVEPVLESITLKDPQNPPGEYKFFNMTEGDYNTVKNFVNTNGWDDIISQI